MSRQDHIFPKYVTLEISSDNPPSDLYEKGSRKCAKCGVLWPAYTIFVPTPCCNRSADLSSKPPDISWADAVKKLHKSRFERYYEKWNDDVTDEGILFDPSIELPLFEYEEEELRQGLEEIDRLIGEQSVND